MIDTNQMRKLAQIPEVNKAITWAQVLELAASVMELAGALDAANAELARWEVGETFSQRAADIFEKQRLELAQEHNELRHTQYLLSLANNEVSDLATNEVKLAAELDAAKRTADDYQFYLDSLRSLIRMYNGNADMGKYGDTYGRLLDVLEIGSKAILELAERP